MINQKIQYVIPLSGEDEESTSLFQGFQSGIIATVKIYDKILRLPHHLLDLSSTRSAGIVSRITGSYNYSILPINKNLLNEIIDGVQKNPFICIFSCNETHEEVDAFLSQTNHPILHVSTEPIDKGVFFDEINSEIIVSYVCEVIEFLRESISKKEYAFLKSIVGKYKLVEEETILLKKRNHLVTAPNELVLEAQNYVFNEFDPLFDSSDIPYIEALIESAKKINEIRNSISGNFLFPPAVTLIVTAPSLYRHFYRISFSDKQSSQEADWKTFRKIFKLLSKQTGYSFEIKQEELQEIVKTKLARSILSFRTHEIMAYTAAVAIKACNNFSPVIRLPPVVNTFHSDLESLAGCSRGNAPSNYKSFKLNKIMRRIENKLSLAIDSSFIEFIDQQYNQVKLISDAPLEWMPIRGLPLMLRYDVSRIPTTPGNLFFRLATYGKQIILPQSAFDEILVIRSFQDGDPIKYLLQESIEITIPEDRRSFIKWVDVNTQQEFIDALNKFSGVAVIYDGHGCHETGTDIGGIKIGNARVNLWELRGKVRVPPIVLLSTCDAHPVDSSHASIANGFLSSGAVTVLASLLPIDAKHSSVFMARLLLRLKDYLSILCKKNKSVRWSQVVSGMLRMSYVFELIVLLTEKGECNFTSELFKKIMLKGNMLINTFDPEWHEKLLNYVSKRIGWDDEKMRKFINDWGKNLECIKYIQLGNPEMILIFDDTFYDSWDDRINEVL